VSSSGLSGLNFPTPNTGTIGVIVAMPDDTGLTIVNSLDRAPDELKKTPQIFLRAHQRRVTVT
jgi:hypothetical protein